MTPKELLKHIDTFTAQYPDSAYSFGHIVLDDYNLSNASIDYCLGSSLRNDSTISGYAIRTQIADFLQSLKDIPEPTRLDAMELAHGEVVE